MMENIIKNDEMITLGEETAAITDLFIHWSDYGDNYMDLTFCYKETGDMFGDCAWCAIPKSKIQTYLKTMKKKSGISDVRKELIEDDLYY